MHVRMITLFPLIVLSVGCSKDAELDAADSAGAEAEALDEEALASGASSVHRSGNMRFVTYEANCTEDASAYGIENNNDFVEIFRVPDGFITCYGMERRQDADGTWEYGNDVCELARITEDGNEVTVSERLCLNVAEPVGDSSDTHLERTFTLTLGYPL